MKILKPQFYGVLGDNSILNIERFIVKSIDALELLVTELPPADIMCLSGVCCLVTGEGKSLIHNCGFNNHSFHKVSIKGIDIDSLYYIDPIAKGNGIEVYRSSSLLVSEEVLEKLQVLKLGDLEVLDYV